MKKIFCSALFLVLGTGALWAHSSTEKPWTYWWWMGSSVQESDITEQLEGMSQAGLGGVHIIPIYGEKGDEAQFIPYLSQRWMEILEHTITQANRLGMGVDMTMGTGWPFGGPDLPEEFRAQRVKIENGKFSIEPTGQKVKRAAPGGEGFVMDHYNQEALRAYAQRFIDAFNSQKLKPRALYNDSFEVYGANCTRDFLEKFKELRGYDLNEVLDSLTPQGAKNNPEERSRVASDYCETISDLLYSEFTAPWVQLCHQKGVGLVRNEAHGSPGNLLDLYALADIPETESFGVSGFNIPGLRNDPKYEEKRFGRPDPLTMKFASSAAHVTGKPLVSSESTTWLGDHFSVALSQIKPQIDELFTAGINHIFFHGTTYSPYGKGFPGRLFYASTHYGHTSHFWEELPALTDYIAQCQHWLQNSQPDNDILLYFPIYDIWSQDWGRGIVKMLDVHYLSRGLKEMAFGRLAQDLWQKGYTFDYVSERMLQERTFRKGQVILIPHTERIPVKVLEALKAQAQRGIPVIFQDSIPTDVPGFFQYKERTVQLAQAADEILRNENVSTGAPLEAELAKYGIRPEPFKEKGVNFIRKTVNGKKLYFLANLSDQAGDFWFTPAHPAQSLTFFDPELKTVGLAASKNTEGQKQFRLQLPPGRSLLVFADAEAKDFAEESELKAKNLESAWVYQDASEAPALPLEGPWTLTYRKGVPQIDEPITVQTAESWTKLGPPYDLFSGKLVYSRDFTLSSEQLTHRYELRLGDVRQTARVSLNGETLPLLWHIPFSTPIPKGILKGNNHIEIEVTNLSFNRVIGLDREKIPWKNFHEINFVNIQYKPFDASKENPLDSGLLSVPQLVPCLLEE